MFIYFTCCSDTVHKQTDATVSAKCSEFLIFKILNCYIRKVVERAFNIPYVPIRIKAQSFEQCFQ